MFNRQSILDVITRNKILQCQRFKRVKMKKKEKKGKRNLRRSFAHWPQIKIARLRNWIRKFDWIEKAGGVYQL